MIKTKTGICFVDAETSYLLTTVFGLKQLGYISHENIIEDWSIYCIALKFIDNPKIYSFSVDPTDLKNDYDVVNSVREVLSETKLLIGHNLDKFDLKKFNTRLIYHKLPPIDHKILTLDTLKAARKHFAFTSNRLDYLGEFLGIGKKMQHREGNPWAKLIRGIDVDTTLKHMVDYCKRDVSPLLEEVYKRIRPYIDHPDLTVRQRDEEYSCTHCGSLEVQKRGTRITKAGKLYTRYQCQACGGWGSEKIQEKKKDDDTIIWSSDE